jgi:hypothetical protein
MPVKDAGTRFEPVSSDASERAPSVMRAASAPDLASLLALQQEDTPRDKRRRNARRGFRMLDALDALRVAYLSGGVTSETVERLVSLQKLIDSEEPDPALRPLLNAVELRAAVELAKLGR